MNAVGKICGDGRRERTRAFTELVSHYLFRDRFGRPGKGNDKGKVEGLVKYTRSNFMTPAPVAASFEALNADLERRCRARQDERAGRHAESIGMRLVADRAVLRALPAVPLEPCEKRAGRVSSTALVRYRSNDYSVPTAYGFRDVLVKGFVEEVAWNAEAMALYLHALFPDCEVIAFHYRGYAPSGGRPSAEALPSDSLLIFDHVQQAHARERVVAIGFSIGSGAAAYLARHRPTAGLILVTPFDSLEALARDLYWWAPVGLLLRHRMPSIDFVRDSLVPTALITAERDTIVPARRSTPLRAAIVNLIFERTINAGHNDLYDRPAFVAAMREALARIEAVSGHAFGR